MKMKKLMGSIIATVMAMGMAGGTSVNAEYHLKPIVMEQNYENEIRNASNDYKRYTTHYYIDNENTVFVEIEMKDKSWGNSYQVRQLPALSITTPSNYVVSESRTGTQKGIYIDCTKATNNDGTITWKLFTGNLSEGGKDTIILFPVGITEENSTIIFKNYRDETLNEYNIENADSSLVSEYESLKANYDQLSATLASQKNRAYGDMNDDGYVDARDASLLLTLYARQSVGDPITLDQLIEEQKEQ